MDLWKYNSQEFRTVAQPKIYVYWKYDIIFPVRIFREKEPYNWAQADYEERDIITDNRQIVNQ
jgi:hypothetical protein